MQPIDIYTHFHSNLEISHRARDLLDGYSRYSRGWSHELGRSLGWGIISPDTSLRTVSLFVAGYIAHQTGPHPSVEVTNVLATAYRIGCTLDPKGLESLTGIAEKVNADGMAMTPDYVPYTADIAPNPAKQQVDIAWLICQLADADKAEDGHGLGASLSALMGRYLTLAACRRMQQENLKPATKWRFRAPPPFTLKDALWEEERKLLDFVEEILRYASKQPELRQAA